jgi:nitrogen fixation protein FixH
MNTYAQGQSVTITWTFRDDDGAPADPITQTVRLKAPNGVVSDLPGDSIERVAQGTFQIVVHPMMHGTWTCYVQGEEGDATPTIEHAFEVRGSAFS